MEYTVQVTFDDGEERWLVELTNGLFGKWTPSPFGARRFDSKRTASAVAENLGLRPDVRSARVEAWPANVVDER